MQIKEYEGELGDLYELWREVAKERPNSLDKDVEQFERENLNAASKEIRCLIAYEGDDLVGASVIRLRPKEASPYMNFLVPEDRLWSDTSKRLLERSLDLCKKNGDSEVHLLPNLYSERFLGFFREQGFEKDEDYPSGLWMRKELVDLDEVQTPEGIEIVNVESLGDEISARDLAEVHRDYMDPNYDFEDLVANFEMVDRDRDILYSVARPEDSDEVVGYSRTMFLEMFGGDKRVHNGGLMVKDEHRNKGIGGALLVDSFLGAKEKGYQEIYISTHSKNPAQRLYKRVGFELVSEHDNLYYEIN